MSRALVLVLSTEECSHVGVEDGLRPTAISLVHRSDAQRQGVFDASTSRLLVRVSRLENGVAAHRGRPDVGKTGHSHGFAYAGRSSRLGDAQSFPAATVTQASDPVAAMAGTPDGKGYWLVTEHGTVIGAGDASAFGSIPASAEPGVPVVCIAPTSTGQGYWLATADGNVYAFGDARYYGHG